MTDVTRTGAVQNVTHVKNALGIHTYQAEVHYTWENPSPPPPMLTETVIHKDLDKEFYDDFRAQVGKAITTTYDKDDSDKAVSGTKIE